MSINAKRVSRRRWLASLGTLSVTGLAGCQSSLTFVSRRGSSGHGLQDGKSEQDDSEPGGVDRVLSLAVGMGGEKRLVPPVLAIERGETVRIHLTNVGTDTRSVSIEAYGLEADLRPGKQTSVTFPFHAPGIFSITTAGGLRHCGQLFVYPTANSTLPRVSERQLRLLVEQVSGWRGLYPSTVFALEDEIVSIEIANRIGAKTTVSITDHSVSVVSDGVGHLSFVPDGPGIYPIDTDGISGQLVVLPQETDFSRITAVDRRRRHIVAENSNEGIWHVPSTLVCKQGEQLVLDVQSPDTVATDDMDTIRTTPRANGIHSLSTLSETNWLDGQLVVLP